MQQLNSVSPVSQLKTLRDSLLGDLARGTATVTDQSGDSITYSSPSQILVAIRELEKRISAVENATRHRPAGCYQIETTRGL